jgi:hypothetical protein
MPPWLSLAMVMNPRKAAVAVGGLVNLLTVMRRLATFVPDTRKRPSAHSARLRVCSAVGDLSAAERDARSGEPAPGEHAGHRNRVVGRDHDEVIGVVLDPDVRDVAAEARGKGGHCVSPALIDWKIEANASTWSLSR